MIGDAVEDVSKPRARTNITEIGITIREYLAGGFAQRSSIVQNSEVRLAVRTVGPLARRSRVHEARP